MTSSRQHTKSTQSDTKSTQSDFGREWAAGFTATFGPSMACEQALTSARLMRAQAREMVEKSAQLWKAARSMRERIRVRKEATMRATETWLYAIGEIRAADKNRRCAFISDRSSHTRSARKSV